MSEGLEEFRRLMERLDAGDPDAAVELLDRYEADLYRVIRCRLHQKMRSQLDSIDVLQSVWAAFFAIAAGHEFTDPGALRTFLLDLATHKAIDNFRRQMKCQRRNRNRERSLDGSARIEALGVADVDPTPSKAAMAGETWHELLQGLPDVSQTILTMLREGKSHREIARTLSVSERTIGRLIRKLTPRRLP